VTLAWSMTSRVAEPQARHKHRQRSLALTVLLAAVVLAALSFPLRSRWWGGWILAIAEAGIVGGLADWFAVTAMFRRPLGLPIPHTALIPANWELMAARVGSMVGDRVLSKAYVTDEIARFDVGDLVARGAERLTRADLESATRWIVRWLVEQFRPETAEQLVDRLRSLLRAYPMAPLLAVALEVAREHGWDERIVTALMRAVRDALDRPAFRDVVVEMIDEVLVRYRRRMGTSPRIWITIADVLGLIDRDRIVAALRAGLENLADDPNHPIRRQLTDALGDLSRRLRMDDGLAARVEAAKVEFLESDVVRRLIEEVAGEARAALIADVASDRSATTAWIADRLERARRTLLADAAMRADLDRWVKRRAVELVDRYHDRIAGFIEKGVHALGPEGAVRLIEEHAGDDLQYIRVNGTVVGGLAGGALYAVHLLLRAL
jgi:uncharacterized membrane-anchored protein YjiN (DUF445 family)